MKRLRLGLIGASRIAAKILPSIRMVNDFEIAGVAARDRRAAEDFALRNSISKVYSNYEALLANPKIDAVYISVINTAHADLIRLSLQLGKHVLCEKPLVLNYDSAKELFELANNQKLILLEGFMYRHHTQVKRMVSGALQGKIGRIASINCNFSFFLHDQNSVRASRSGGGGSLNDLGCYLVDFANWINLHSNVESVSSRFIKNDEIDVAFSAIFQYANGCLVTLAASTETSGPNLWEISGSTGSVSAFRNDPHGAASTNIFYVNQESQLTQESVIPGDQFKYEFQNFADAILKVAPPAVLPVESIRNAEVMDLIRNSASLTKLT